MWHQLPLILPKSRTFCIYCPVERLWCSAQIGTSRHRTYVTSVALPREAANRGIDRRTPMKLVRPSCHDLKKYSMTGLFSIKCRCDDGWHYINRCELFNFIVFDLIDGMRSNYWLMNHKYGCKELLARCYAICLPYNVLKSNSSPTASWTQRLWSIEWFSSVTRQE